jgi:hypothetical protein
MEHSSMATATGQLCCHKKATICKPWSKKINQGPQKLCSDLNIFMVKDNDYDH